MNKKPFKLGIIVGRFQTIHSGHEMMINKAVSLCDEVGIFVGSSQEQGTAKNPYSYELRERLLSKLFGDSVRIFPLPDIGVGNVSKWGDYVLEQVYERFGKYPDLLVSGKESRRISWFDNADGMNISELYIPKSIDISASEMRDFLIDNDFEEWKKYTNPAIWDEYDFLREAVIDSKDNDETQSV